MLFEVAHFYALEGFVTKYLNGILLLRDGVDC